MKTNALLLGILLLCLSSMARACGWWGDGESRGEDIDAVIVDKDGNEVTIEGGLQEAEHLFQKAERARRDAVVMTDQRQILHWYEQAATLGHVGAQYTLGLLFETGVLFPPDLARAANWYRFAAGQGDPHAQYYLGIMYLAGRGVASEKSQAILWLEASADQGHVDSMPMLAQLYWDNGSRIEALIWWRTSAALGNQTSQKLFQQMQSLLKSDEQIQAQRISDEKLLKWKNMGHPDGIN